MLTALFLVALTAIICNSLMSNVCQDPFDAFRVPSESLNNEIYGYASYDSIWLDLIKRGMWQGGKGTTASVFTINNVEPTSDVESWETVSLTNDSNDNLCDPTWNDVEYGYVEETYGPETYAIRGPQLCKNNFIYMHNIQGFMEDYTRVLAKRARRSWEKRYEYWYMRYSRKIPVRTSFTYYDQLAFTGIPQATCELTQEFLDEVAIQLTQDAATNPDSKGYISYGESGPLYTLYIGLKASQAILKNNAEFRADVRYADPGQLLSRLGAVRSVKNFKHLPCLYPPRFNYDGANYNRVNTFTTQAQTKGTATVVATGYKNATHEAALVLSPDVLESEIVQPVNSVPGATFNPTSYMGDWKFVTGKYRTAPTEDCYDPMDKYGRHFAEFAHAPKPGPGKFKWGWVILFERCTTNLECVSCSS